MAVYCTYLIMSPKFKSKLTEFEQQVPKLGPPGLKPYMNLLGQFISPGKILEFSGNYGINQISFSGNEFLRGIYLRLVDSHILNSATKWFLEKKYVKEYDMSKFRFKCLNTIVENWLLKYIQCHYIPILLVYYVSIILYLEINPQILLNWTISSRNSF